MCRTVGRMRTHYKGKLYNFFPLTVITQTRRALIPIHFKLFNGFVHDPAHRFDRLNDMALLESPDRSPFRLATRHRHGVAQTITRQ